MLIMQSNFHEISKISFLRTIIALVLGVEKVVGIKFMEMLFQIGNEYQIARNTMK